MITLKLFGGVLLQRDDRPLCGPATQRHRLALLALLAVSHPRPVSRDKLIGFLWPERHTDQARNVLNQALHTLRQALGHGALVSAGDELRFEPAAVAVDVIDFEAALAAGDLERGVRLYSGPLLDGFFLPGAPEFERWLDDQRERCRREHCAALERLAEAAAARGDVPAAAEWWKRLYTEEPHSARVTLRLMETLAAMGDRAAAIRHAHIHALRLREELDAAPDPEVNALAERLRREPVVRVRENAKLVHGSAEGATLTGNATTLPAPGARADATPLAGTSPVDAGEVVEATPSDARPYLPGAGSVWPHASSSRRPLRSRRVMALVGVVGLVALAGVFWLRQPPLDTLRPERVVVTLLENQTGDLALDPIGRMAADWVARGLMEISSIEVISPTSALYAMEVEEHASVREIARRTGAGTAVAGAYYREGDVLRFEVQVTDALRGRLLHTLEPIRVPVDSATHGAELLRQRVAAVLAARFDWPRELREITGRTQPPTYTAYAEFVEGMDLFISRSQYTRAAERFERAWALDTTFHLPRLYTSLMYLNLGELARMEALLHSVEVHRDRLSTYERVLLESLQALLGGDHESALRAARQMNEMAPGSLLAGHAVLAVSSNRPREAIEVLRQLDLERDFLRGWEFYGAVLTTAWHMLGEHRRELNAARQERLRQPELLSGRLLEVRALAALGRIGEAERLLQESLTLPLEPGWTPAGLLRGAAAELRAHGHAEAAARALEQALAWYASRPAEEQLHHRAGLARTLYEAGRWAEARTLFEALAAEEPENLHHLGHLGTLAARRGERGEAEQISVALVSSTQPYLRGAHTLWRARIAAQLGQREQALLLLREALAQGQPHWLWLHTDPDLDPLRDEPAFRELIRPKG